MNDTKSAWENNRFEITLHAEDNSTLQKKPPQNSGYRTYSFGHNTQVMPICNRMSLENMQKRGKNKRIKSKLSTYVDLQSTKRGIATVYVLQCIYEFKRGHPKLFSQSQDNFRTKESKFSLSADQSLDGQIYLSGNMLLYMNGYLRS